ncbi:MAG: FecR domain-containing protein [Sphingomonas sp.]
MIEQESGTIGENARLWAIRVQDPHFADWDGFTAWLEQSPAHLAAYEATLEDDRWAEDLFRSAPPSRPEPPAAPPLRRRWAFAGTAAAALVAIVGGWAALDREAPVREVATAPGEHRTIALADGSRMILNGATRVAFSESSPRAVELISGEALFEVHHDTRNPFVVTVAGTRLVDAGTVFNVVRDRGGLDVAVAHGAVIYAPGKEQIRLDAGAGLSRASDGARPVLRKTSPDGIGGWQVGQLQYDDATLAQVGRDLGRNLGQAIKGSDATDRLHFTGTLVLTGPPDQVLARAGLLLGVRFVRGKDGWTMAPTDAAPH